MIDVKHLVENTDLYTRELEKRFMDSNLALQTRTAYEEWKVKQAEFEQLRSRQNSFNDQVVKLSGDEKATAIAQMKQLSEQVKGLEAEIRELRENLDQLLYKLPNLTWDGIPVGPDDGANVETQKFGTKPEFDFEPKNYFDLPVFGRDYLSEKGVEAAGMRGYYMKGELARFQRVLFDWVLERITAKGFEYVIPPIMVNEKVMEGTGFFPASREDIYEIKAGDKELFLTGTSEPGLMFMEAGNVLDLTKPRMLTAWTTCFRKESGSYGKDTKGGIRVHEFPKIETVLICKPEDSARMFDLLTETFTENMSALGLHLHHLEVSSGDIAMKNHRQVDIEAWFPAQSAFRELSSSSNCTDYQTRNLNIRYKDEAGNTKLAHSLNCTGVTNRALFAIMEQFQQADGSVRVPQALQERFGKELLN